MISRRRTPPRARRAPVGTDPATIAGSTGRYFAGPHNTKNAGAGTLSLFQDKSGTLDFSTATESFQPLWSDPGAPNADGIDDRLVAVGGVDYLLNISGWGMLAVVEPNGVQADITDATYKYEAPAIVAATTGYWGVFLYGTGGQNYAFTSQRHTPIYTNLTALAVPSSGKHVIGAGYAGGSIWTQYGATVATAACGDINTVSGNINLCANWNATDFLKGTIHALYLFDQAKSAASLSDGIEWLRYQWGAL